LFSPSNSDAARTSRTDRVASSTQTTSWPKLQDVVTVDSSILQNLLSAPSPQEGTHVMEGDKLHVPWGSHSQPRRLQVRLPTRRTQLAHTADHQHSTPDSCAQDPGPLDDDIFTSGLDDVAPQPRVVDASRERRLEVASPSPDADQNTTVCDASTPCSSSNFCNFNDGSAGFCEPCDGCAGCDCGLNNNDTGVQSCIQACLTPPSSPPTPLPPSLLPSPPPASSPPPPYPPVADASVAESVSSSNALLALLSGGGLTSSLPYATASPCCVTL
jgi:hypothetical protein